MSKMVYLPYVRFEQEEGEAEGIGWYFTQYNAETGEGKGWYGTEFMPDCLFETKCEGGEPETKFFDVNTNEPIKRGVGRNRRMTMRSRTMARWMSL